jgi:hypothetical protein
MFEDAGGCRHGPHSLAELSYWHHSSYIQDLSMVRETTIETISLLNPALPYFCKCCVIVYECEDPSREAYSERNSSLILSYLVTQT